MSTLRQLVSSIRSMSRIMSTDAMITDRAIASEIRSNSLLLIKRETNLRRLWQTDTLFTTIPCLPMKEVPISECADFQENLLIARSVEKLPKIAEGIYNYMIQGVYSINVLSGKGKKLKEVTVNRYLNLLKLPMKKNEEYYFINNDYVYVTSSFVEKIRIAALFEKPIPNTVLFPEGSCGDNVSLEDYCRNPLDRDFYLPGYLEKQILDLTHERLLRTYFQIQQDVSNEGVDGQQSNSGPTD